MHNIQNSKLFSIILIITIIGEFLVPYILKHFYPKYDSKTMVMSALGSPESPVRNIYNLWLIWLGLFLLFASIVIYNKSTTYFDMLSFLISFCIAVFAIGAGIMSAIFSVNESKDVVNLSSKIHGLSSAIGFMSLLFFPLLKGISSFTKNDFLEGILCIISFLLATVFFIFFIMGDKEKFKNTIFSYEGLWERLALFCMYIPFLYIGISNLLI